MRVTVKKYGRWDENCNWQLQSKVEKQMSEEAFENFKNYGGWNYYSKHDEWYVISEDKLKKTVVKGEQI